MDTQRAVLWIIFSMSLLFLWDGWQKSHGHLSLFGVGGQTAGINSPKPGAGTGSPSAHTNATSLGSDFLETSGGLAKPTNLGNPSNLGNPTKRVQIQTDTLKVDFDLEGAQIIRAELLKQADSVNPTKNLVLLDLSPERTYLAQSGLIANDSNEPLPNHRSPFVLTSQATTLQDDRLDVVFEAQSGDIKLTKTFSFSRGHYYVNVKHTVTNLGSSARNPSLYLQLTRDGNKPPGESKFYSTYTGPAIYTDEKKFQKVDFSAIEKNKTDYVKQAKEGWLAIIQHYFVSAWVPSSGVVRQYDTAKVAENLYAIRSIENLGVVAPGAQVVNQAQLYIGPQDQQQLASIAPGLDLVVDYGWLTLIAKPLFSLLKWLHSWVNNWGWAIVLLTVLVKAAFYPLSAASYKSMARMKELMPKLTKLREQYADDRAKLNVAMMELYRTEKINPFGGCLPVVVQIPVFISLYWVLLASVEMRNAPWIGWVHDLAVPDPWFILPAVMMITMFLQTKLNPTPPDPIQAKVMMIMPLIFGGMMFFFPAGLVLYWVVNNILSILQQWSITRSMSRSVSAKSLAAKTHKS